MQKEYPKFKRNEVGRIFEDLQKAEKTIIADYLIYRKARGVSTKEKLADIQRYLTHIRFIIEKPFKDMTLKDLRELLAIINSSRLTNFVKNSVKTDLKNFLKYLFHDWSMRFAELEDIRLGSNGKNEKKINSQTIYSHEDIEKMMRSENKTFYKAFLMTQFEAGLRTGETRSLKWNSIKLKSDGDISEINIFATKTQKARPVFVEKATFYLQKLKEEQENQGIKSPYVFPAKKNLNEPIDKATISTWFRDLSKKALGRQGWNYLLRHSRATELYKLADENKISKKTAIRFMGHSEDMSDTYTHIDDKPVKEMLKSQVYKIEDLPEEKKHELEKQIEEIKLQIKELSKLKNAVEDMKLLIANAGRSKELKENEMFVVKAGKLVKVSI